MCGNVCIVKGDNAPSPTSSAASHSPTSRWRDSTSLDATSEQERTWRSAACDYELRFCGHCNTTTDIKEANFFGRLDISLVIFLVLLQSIKSGNPVGQCKLTIILVVVKTFDGLKSFDL